MTAYPGPQAAAWWRGLQPQDGLGERRPGDRGALARLRRCASVMDAASEPATLALCRRLGAGEAGLERAALLAAVLAHVREDDPRLPVARQIGVPSDGAAPMSDLRFRRLLQAETPDEQLIGFRRLVALAGRKLNVADLAAGLWRWNDEATRRHWIYAYHDAPEFQPGANATQPVTEDASA
jgi:CRISPR system Cascade subunit CasB